MSSVTAKSVTSNSSSMLPTPNVGRSEVRFAASNVKHRQRYAGNIRNAQTAKNLSMQCGRSLNKAMGTTVPSNVGLTKISQAQNIHVLHAEKKSTKPNGKLPINGQDSVLLNAEPLLSKVSATEEICSEHGTNENGLEKVVCNAEALSGCNLTTSYLASLAGLVNKKMRKHYAGLATGSNIGRKIYRITHGLDRNQQLDVDKFSLIDLEAQKWATGRKAVTGHRERLSERTPETVMRQSEQAYNPRSA